MPPQHIEIHETISALKRALRREKEAPSDEPIYSATNRGNKLKRGATYVHAGALPYAYGPHGYKEKIEHAGYTRYILDRNPRRYNEYGEELEDSESDTEADADADEENPYSGVRLEELLCPLKHPADLATHPTLSLPFLDSALPDIVRTTDEKLRQERANLWRAKNLNRHFVGDETWMPSESVENVNDWDLFEPKSREIIGSARKRGKRNAAGDLIVNGEHELDLMDGKEDKTISNEDISNNQTQTEDTQIDKGDNLEGDPTDSEKEAVDEIVAPSGDIDMKDDENNAGAEGIEQDLQHVNGVINGEHKANGTHPIEGNNVGEADSTEEAADHSSTENSPAPPPRRITRALAAETHNSTTATPPLSPTSSIISYSSSMLKPDPIFLLPQPMASAHTRPHALLQLGLPIEEILETRRLLSMYIQKQEESVRGHEAVLGKLVKAKRMRDTLWEWCKAEGHVGEWSDGEDWVDAEAWGVAPEELRKGKDEEELEGVEEVGRKGKRRRNRE